MSQHKVRDAESATLSRRTVIGALGAGIAVAGSGASLAQPVAPPTTITNPPRDFSRRGAPTTYFTDPDVLSVDPVFDGIAQPNSAIQRLWTGALWSEGPGLERRRPLPRLERHPEQPPAALARGRRPRLGVPHAVQQLQRQHLRLPGPPALLRAPDAARRALRARRLDHGPRRQLRGQAAQLAQRRRAASGRQLLVHRSALWRPALRGRARRRRRADERRGAAQAAARPGGRHRRLASASCRPTSIASTRAAGSTW